MKKQKKILIVDDEQDLCFLMESFFTKNNQTVQPTIYITLSIQHF